ncbi:MAG: S46 family peptidase [Bacteroidales bacterium]
MLRKGLLTLSLAAIFSGSVTAEEGMWLLPTIGQNAAKMKSLGLELDHKDIYNPDSSSLKDAIVIFGNGCTGEVISSNGLILTNHHCGYDAIQTHSTVEKDYLKDGFWAMSNQEEVYTPGLKVTFIDKIEDVTDFVKENLAKDEDPTGMNFLSPKYLNTLTTKLIGEDFKQNNPGFEVVIKPHYNGNKYLMYYMKIYSDVRMVGAPPSSIGKFGFDTDNWMWPRHTGDFALFRVYADKDGNPSEYSQENEPLKAKRWLKISLGGIEENDYAMIMGFPGSTFRYMTSWEVAERRMDNTIRVEARGARQDVLIKEMLADPAVNIQYASKYARSSNYWKNSIGMNRGIDKLKVISRKESEQDEYKKWATSTGRSEFANAVDQIGKLVDERKETRKQLISLSEYITGAIEFVNAPAIGDKLYSALESKNRDSIEVEISKLETAYSRFANKDYNPEVDRKVAKVMLRKYMEMVDSNNHPEILTTIVKEYKGNIDAFVDDCLDNSIYANQENFNKFIKKPSVKTLKSDPMVRFNSSIKGEAKRLSSLLESNGNEFAKARKTFLEGYLVKNSNIPTYPDANFTIRMTYGSVKPYEPADGAFYNYYTTLKGVMQKEDPNNFEFVVPERLKEIYSAKDFGRYAMKDGRMPVAFISSNDITGGNSGSPVMNSRGELIGTAFDGNWEAMSGDLVFEPELQRTINVDIRYTLFIIEKYAGCKRLIDELEIVD